MYGSLSQSQCSNAIMFRTKTSVKSSNSKSGISNTPFLKFKSYKHLLGTNLNFTPASCSYVIEYLGKITSPTLFGSCGGSRKNLSKSVKCCISTVTLGDLFWMFKGLKKSKVSLIKEMEFEREGKARWYSSSIKKKKWKLIFM